MHQRRVWTLEKRARMGFSPTPNNTRNRLKATTRALNSETNVTLDDTTQPMTLETDDERGTHRNAYDRGKRTQQTKHVTTNTALIHQRRVQCCDNSLLKKELWTTRKHVIRRNTAERFPKRNKREVGKVGIPP